MDAYGVRELVSAETMHNAVINHDNKIRMLSIGQKEVIETYLQSKGVSHTFNINSPMPNKYGALSDPRLLEGVYYRISTALCID